MRCTVTVSMSAAALLSVAAPAHAARVVVRIAPPPVMVEPIPVPPIHGDYLWRPGYWSWTGAHYAWVPGVYVTAPRTRAAWIPGHWVAAREGWVWVSGRWR
jgi:hypothetical protein